MNKTITYTVSAEIEDTLEVPENATDRDIKKAIVKAAAKHEDFDVSWDDDEHEVTGELMVNLDQDTMLALLEYNSDVQIGDSTYEITDLIVDEYKTVTFDIKFTAALIDGSRREDREIAEAVAGRITEQSNIEVETA